LTEEQKAKLEKKSTKTVSGAVETGTEGMVKGTGNVVLGVKKGFQWTGDKVAFCVISFSRSDLRQIPHRLYCLDI